MSLLDKILQKLTSRKLWMAIAGVTTGIAMSLGASGSEVDIIAGAVTAIVSIVTYIITEGRIDAEGVKNAVESTKDAIDVIKGDDINESEN